MDEQQVNHLRSVIADEGQPLAPRRSAAEHMIELRLEAVEAATIPDDDPEVSALCTPWSNTGLAALFSKGPDTPVLKGWSLPDAKEEVTERRKLRALLAVVVDEAAHALERLAACERILRDFPVGRWRMNGYTSARMLAEVLPADAMKYDAQSWRRGPVEVARPPLELADVWRF